MDSNAYPNVRLTRADWDYLYSAIDKSIIAQARLRDAVVKLSQGQTADAEILLAQQSTLLIESQNAWRQLFVAVMSSALPEMPHG